MPSCVGTPHLPAGPDADREALGRVAKSVGVDAAAWEKAARERPFARALAAERAENRRLALEGEPVFLLSTAAAARAYVLDQTGSARDFERLVKRLLIDGPPATPRPR